MRGKPTTLTLLIFVLLLVGCTAPATTGVSHEGMTDMDHAGMDGVAEMQAGVDAIAALSGEEFEIAFLDAMIPHHQSALDMAKIALERSEDSETRAVAQAILSAQEAEITQMSTWLKEWHDLSPSGEDHGMAMHTETDALRTVPAEEFDAAFYTAMIPHHESAIAMAALVAERTSRAEMLTLANAIMTTQQAEIAQFQGWLADQ